MSTSIWNDEQEKPIKHLRVIDLSVMVTGPYLTRILAQYGADVVKVEMTPDGDPLRKIKETSFFELLNQGKKSIGVDLKKAEAIAVVRQLVSEADVFVENFPEGVMEKMGLGYSDLSKDNPDLIYVSLRGMSGKNSIYPAHDLNFIAASGVGEWFLETGVPNYSTCFGDMVGGVMVPAMKLLMHLANPNRHGMHLVSHMDEGFRSLYLGRAYAAFCREVVTENERKTPGEVQTFNGTAPNSRFYKCRDNHWISLQAIEQKNWDIFCDVICHPDWKDRITDTKLVGELELMFLDAPSTYWESLLANKEGCLFRVIPWNEHIVFSQARSQLSQDPLSWAGFAEFPSIKPAPFLGEDTFSVLHSLGMTNKEITDGLGQGVISQSVKK